MGFLFCSPTAAKIVHETPVAVRRFGRRWAMVMVVSSEALPPGTAPAVVVMTGDPPPSNNSARVILVRWVNGASSSGNSG
jgi:hypothetical protein